MNDKIKKLTGLSETIKLFNNNSYWLRAIQKIYRLSNSEMGFIILNLKGDKK